MTSKFAPAFSVVLLLSGLTPRPAHACSCGPKPAPCEGFWKGAAVFVGRVESIGRAPSQNSIFADRIVTFNVVEAFKGVTTSQAVVRTGSGGGNCGYPFRQGHEYFVYAFTNELGELTTGICSRTAPVPAAAVDMAFARQAMSTPLGRIGGEVKLGHYALVGRARAPRSMPNVGVLITKEGMTHRVTTDERGQFKVEGLGAGTYAVALDLTDRFYVDMRPKDVELLDARGCADVRATAYDNGRAAGRILDAAGKPLPSLTLELTLPDGIDDPHGPERLRTVSDRDGRYEFSRVPQGRFVIGINTRRDRPGSALEPRVFHPGVQRLAEAGRVIVGSGERVSVGDFVMPAAVPYVRVAGVVLDADGVPAEGARLFVLGAVEGDGILSEPVLTDPYGRFVVSALAGRAYRLFAERPRPGDRRRVDSSDQLAITPAEHLKPLTLVLRRRY